MSRAKFVLAALLAGAVLSGCPATMSGAGGECELDSECSGEVCARDHQCHAAADVREVTVRWTIRGQAPSVETCLGKDLYVEFDGLDLDQTIAFTPVPCPAGKFTVDKLPDDYLDIEVGPTGRGEAEVAPIDSSNAATVDLRL